MSNRVPFRFAALHCVLLLGVLAASPAYALKVQFGSNFYEFVGASNISWEDARAAAAASTFGGVNGHLATVTSAAENAFLYGLLTPPFDGFAGSWLGGQVEDTDPGPSQAGDTGRWMVGPETGQAFSLGQVALAGWYANWDGVEPNNAHTGPGPSAAYMHVGDEVFSNIDPGRWADSAGGLSHEFDPIRGYFVEYESPVFAQNPEPSVLALLGIALLGFFARRRPR